MAKEKIYADCTNCTRPNGTKYRYCEFCRATNKAAQARYRPSPKEKAKDARYAKTEKGRAVGRASSARYALTEKGRAAKLRARRRYESSKKGMATKRRYQRTKKTKRQFNVAKHQRQSGRVRRVTELA